MFVQFQNESLKIEGNSETEIINLKVEPELNHFLKGQDGVLPAYHMNKEHWVSIILDSSFPKDELISLIQMSYVMTK